MNRHQLGGAVLVLIAGAILWEAKTHGFSIAGSGYAAPLFALAIAAMGGLVVLFGGDSDIFSVRAGFVLTMGLVLACGFVAGAMDVLGYRASIAIAVVFLFGALEGRHPAAVIGAALLLAFGSHYLLETTLHVPLPRGFMSF